MPLKSRQAQLRSRPQRTTTSLTVRPRSVSRPRRYSGSGGRRSSSTDSGERESASRISCSSSPVVFILSSSFPRDCNFGENIMAKQGGNVNGGGY